MMLNLPIEILTKIFKRLHNLTDIISVSRSHPLLFNIYKANKEKFVNRCITCKKIKVDHHTNHYSEVLEYNDTYIKHGICLEYNNSSWHDIPTYNIYSYGKLVDHYYTNHANKISDICIFNIDNGQLEGWQIVYSHYNVHMLWFDKGKYQYVVIYIICENPYTAWTGITSEKHSLQRVYLPPTTDLAVDMKLNDIVEIPIYYSNKITYKTYQVV